VISLSENMATNMDSLVN